MLAKNDTPFSVICFKQWHQKTDVMMAVVAVRARYDLFETGELYLSETQEIILSDEYEGDPTASPLLRVSDLIPYKPSADVTVLADAYPPNGLAQQWTVSLRVGAHEHALRVYGPREWKPLPSPFGKMSWRMEPTKPVECVPLTYARASGGYVIGNADRLNNPDNPAGCGLIDKDFYTRDRSFPAPQIEALNAPIRSPFERMQPQGFCPIPAFWRLRQQYAGTYDDEWKARAPLAPLDFDYRFYQTAHPNMILSSYPTGDERITAKGLIQGGGELTFTLPQVQPVALFEWDDGRQTCGRLNLDGLHLDLRGDPPWRVDLTWRGWNAICPRFFSASLFVRSLSEARDYPWSGPDGLTES